MKQSFLHNHYVRLAVMAVLSFAAMYVLMYAMVNSFSNVFSNLNQFYMAGLMTIPMVIIELFLMRTMYTNKRWNGIILGVCVIAFVGFFMLIRQQVAIGDREFLKSMIPHHAGAILMCEQADVKDPEIKALCEAIIVGQQKEIDQMKHKLDEMR